MIKVAILGECMIGSTSSTCALSLFKTLSTTTTNSARLTLPMSFSPSMATRHVSGTIPQVLEAVIHGKLPIRPLAATSSFQTVVGCRGWIWLQLIRRLSLSSQWMWYLFAVSSLLALLSFRIYTRPMGNVIWLMSCIRSTRANKYLVLFLAAMQRPRHQIYFRSAQKPFHLVPCCRLFFAHSPTLIYIP